MKVIHLISGGDTGGAKTHVHSLLQNLSRGMDITLVCFRDGPFAREAAELGIETRVCSGGFFSALREVRRMIAEEGFELVHTHGSRANLAGAILRSTCGRGRRRGSSSCVWMRRGRSTGRKACYSSLRQTSWRGS